MFRLIFWDYDWQQCHVSCWLSTHQWYCKWDECQYFQYPNYLFFCFNRDPWNHTESYTLQYLLILWWLYISTCIRMILMKHDLHGILPIMIFIPIETQILVHLLVYIIVVCQNKITDEPEVELCTKHDQWYGDSNIFCHFRHY